MSQDLVQQHADLIRRVAQRDRRAYAALFAYYAPRLKAFAMKGGLTADIAEEVMQEAMIAVWRRADTFDARKASASTWMFTIVRNKRIDYLRRASKPALTAEDFAHEIQEVAGADSTLEALQDENRVKKQIAQLPADQLKVIKKAFFEDKSHSEVAEELGLPLGTVKSRIRLALTKMRQMLESEPS